MFLFGKGKINKQIDDLNVRYNNLKNNTISSSMEKLKMISENNEEYKELYIVIEANYNSLINNFILDIEECISNLENSKNIMDVKLVKNEIKNISDKLDRAEYEKKQIYTQINSMFDKENRIRESLTPLKEAYRQFVSNYNEIKNDLDMCSSLFENTIINLSAKIDLIETHLSNGQYNPAEVVLKEFRELLNVYVNHLKVMPEMVGFTFKILPSRYNAVLELYEEMKNEGYVLFSIKMGAYQDEIDTLFERVKNSFSFINLTLISLILKANCLILSFSSIYLNS